MQELFDRLRINQNSKLSKPKKDLEFERKRLQKIQRDKIHQEWIELHKKESEKRQSYKEYDRVRYDQSLRSGEQFVPSKIIEAPLAEKLARTTFARDLNIFLNYAKWAIAPKTMTKIGLEHEENEFDLQRLEFAREQYNIEQLDEDIAAVNGLLPEPLSEYVVEYLKDSEYAKLPAGEKRQKTILVNAARLEHNARQHQIVLGNIQPELNFLNAQQRGINHILDLPADQKVIAFKDFLNSKLGQNLNVFTVEADYSALEDHISDQLPFQTFTAKDPGFGVDQEINTFKYNTDQFGRSQVLIELIPKFSDPNNRVPRYYKLDVCLKAALNKLAEKQESILAKQKSNSRF